MRLRVIACEVLHREICHVVAHSSNQCDVVFLEKGLHDLGGAAMRQRLQAHIDAAGADHYDAVAMGYALCGNGLHGLLARALPVVAPRAHDCIALLLGSAARYNEYFSANPGTYFRSSGWLERGKGLTPLVGLRTGVDNTLRQLIERYGVDNGTYLYNELNRYRQAYTRLAFIENGFDPRGDFAREARAEAEANHWEYTTLSGGLRLLQTLVDGPWDEREFLVVEPGRRIVARYDEQIIHAVRGEE